MFDINEILRFLYIKAGYNDDLRYKLETLEELEAEGKKVFTEFRNQLSEEINKIVEKLRAEGVDVAKLKPYSFQSIAEDILEDYFSVEKTGYFTIIFGESMGFEEVAPGQWEVFEGSDEPGPLDMHLYKVLVLKDKSGKIKLFGVHGRDFVYLWRDEGIPEDTYFASKRWIAERYWHPEGNDVLVMVKLPFDAVVETADNEYKTIRTVEPDEFVIRFL